MAIDATRPAAARLRASYAATDNVRKPDRRTARHEQPIEAIALCDEVGAAISRQQDHISARSWQGVFDECIRIGALVTAARVEFRRLAGAIERGEA